MKEKGVRRLLVLARASGTLMGVVSLDDLAGRISDSKAGAVLSATAKEAVNVSV